MGGSPSNRDGTGGASAPPTFRSPILVAGEEFAASPLHAMALKTAETNPKVALWWAFIAGYNEGRKEPKP